MSREEHSRFLSVFLPVDFSAIPIQKIKRNFV